MFDDRDDFKFVDVRAPIAGLGVLPERAGVSGLVGLAKDLAFYREAFYERSRIRTTASSDEAFEKVVVGKLLAVDAWGKAWSFWDDGNSGKIATILGKTDTATGAVLTRWWHFDGIDRSPVNGVVMAPGEFDVAFARQFRDAEAARVHIPREHDHTELKDPELFVNVPLVNPAVWIRDEFYAVKMADASGLDTPSYGGTARVKKRWTQIEKRKDESTGEWTSTTTTGTITGDDWSYVHQVDRTETTEVDYTLTVDSTTGGVDVIFPFKDPDRVVKAYLYFNALGRQETDGTIVTDQVQAHVVEATPHEVDRNLKTVTFRVPASTIAGFGGSLPTALPGSGSEGSRFVSVGRYGTIERAVFKFNLRTGLQDISWDYVPDDTITTP